MYAHCRFHTDDIRNKRILVTGGAGFIGSNLVEYLLTHGAALVRVADNLSNGFRRNIEPFLKHPNFEFAEGTITDENFCREICEGMHLVSHQAALGSVPRSIAFPLATHAANATGFLNMINAARSAGAERFIYASSSSVYGDEPNLPKREERLGRPLSPYAVSKLTNELYANVFALNYGMKVIGLRYFNVFGPNQDPNGPYAAAIPLFMDAVLKNKPAYINGDGNQTRDFTYVENAVQANVRAMFCTNPNAFGKVYNVAVGENVTINQLFELIAACAGSRLTPLHREDRPGDIRDSLADISLASQFLGYQPRVKLAEGIRFTFDWFKKTFAP
jgi:UDP-N-acetylglucosamine 4-epimerase